ncbi:hypothetical protein SAMN04244572_04933 [Azotobacter beijerinckii]|uniref:UDP-N-acetylglucosamine kinase n=1 Tax=Azotobacter beijerinckii TaxID=170623 RepID=A0A1H7B0B5_9GAMM|nr:ATP-binding protein [Azotobacter beijerinckii]SEJ69647.1 hypothetical protein SAMN04244572_04933 [Azotobacter beijerinckii]
MSLTPRLRMFAGPNGSGKSTIKEVIPPQLLGIYINPDEIEKGLRQSGYLDFSDFAVQAADSEVMAHLRSSSTTVAFLKRDEPAWPRPDEPFASMTRQ